MENFSFKFESDNTQGDNTFAEAMKDAPEFNPDSGKKEAEQTKGETKEQSQEEFIDELKNDPTNKEIGDKYCSKSDIVRSYCNNFPFNEDVRRGFVENIFPRMERHDPETESLEHTTNAWGMGRNEYGINDYVASCFIKRVNPRNIRDLMQIYREIPTGDYSKFEANRRDAIALQKVLYPARDFIHDERPGVHELLSAMLNYYDTRENVEKHSEAEARLREIIDDRLSSKDAGYYGAYGDDKIDKFCFDLSNYEKQIERDVLAGNDRMGTVHYDEPAVDILRRMVKNTEQVALEKPKPNDEKLNELLASYNPHFNKETGEAFVDFAQTGELVKRANEILRDKQGELGIEPSMIETLSYIERMATYALRGIGKRDYKELPFDPAFKEMVRFRELTASPNKYDEGGFECFYQGFLVKFSKGWPDELSEKYALLGKHIMPQITEMVKEYREEGMSESMIDSLWSGNLTHELIGLVDER